MKIVGKRQVFYSFHYVQDNWRVSQIRNIGQIHDNKPVSDNKWEEVKKKGDKAIQAWIDENLNYRSCIVVLVGENTARRKWIDYEIEKSWNDGKGVVGIHIHNLKNSKGEQANKGSNPFDHFSVGQNKKKLSSIVKCYDPPYKSSTYVYDHIKEHLEDWIEEAINIRNEYK
ncbi:MAG: TIR domain-containing protein [Candidatus Kapabacteria bacterium]|nr:TIR domain-containing protein [Candidatus Kapabacteria bacterium]